jgi:cytochrome c-type biogenesis protein CcmE
MGQDGTFHATTLLAKCASRYENAPTDPNAPPGVDKYKQTPGYKAATGTKA